MFQISLAAVGVEHVHADVSRLWVEDVGDHGKQLLEVSPVLLFDFQHADEHAGHLFTELLPDALQFLQKRIQPDLEVLVVVYA